MNLARSGIILLLVWLFASSNISCRSSYRSINEEILLETLSSVDSQKIMLHHLAHDSSISSVIAPTIQFKQDRSLISEWRGFAYTIVTIQDDQIQNSPTKRILSFNGVPWMIGPFELLFAGSAWFSDNKWTIEEKVKQISCVLIELSYPMRIVQYEILRCRAELLCAFAAQSLIYADANVGFLGEFFSAYRESSAQGIKKLGSTIQGLAKKLNYSNTIQMFLSCRLAHQNIRCEFQYGLSLIKAVIWILKSNEKLNSRINELIDVTNENSFWLSRVFKNSVKITNHLRVTVNIKPSRH